MNDPKIEAEFIKTVNSTFMASLPNRNPSPSSSTTSLSSPTTAEPTSYVSDIEKALISSMRTAANNILPDKPPPNQSCKHEIWKNDPEINDLIEQRANVTPGTYAYKEMTKRMKKRANHLRYLKLDKEAAEINMKAINNDIRELFKEVSRDNSSFKKNSSSKCDPQELKEFFEMHF